MKERKGNNFRVNIQEPFIKSFLFQILFGFKELHSRNIFHRDLKLANILYSMKENQMIFKISDFGISKKIEIGQVNQFQTKVGSDFYRPPEVVGDPELCISQSYGVDMYPIGMITYNLALGNVLFK